MDKHTLHTQLAGIVGAENLTDAADTPPFAKVLPGTIADVVEIVKFAEAQGIGLIPTGGGTALHTGYSSDPTRTTLLLSSARLNRVVDYQPEDMTVTCEPGVTLAEVQAVLAERRQMLALDVPLARKATLGGIVSSNRSGFGRPSFGSPRDLLIGVRAVMSDGVEVKGGGRVVKNVAGYDVCKLFTGAWGSLGFITELTFKIRSCAELETVLVCTAPDLRTAVEVGLSLHQAQLAPLFLSVTNELDGEANLLIGLQGAATRVEWQVQEMKRRVTGAGMTVKETALGIADFEQLLDRQARLPSDFPLSARISCLPADLPELISRLSVAGAFLTVHCPTGSLSIGWKTATGDLVRRVQTGLPGGANLLWTYMENDLMEREEVAVWGEKREDFALHRAIKQSLDPKQTFSPGRFYGKL